MPGSDYLPMVHWFSPRQLIRTVAEMATVKVVTRILDPRPLERHSGPIAPIGDWEESKEVWIDYLADTGDGWNSTFSVARALTQEQLDLVDPALVNHPTRRGNLLVLGGDLVYPTPREGNYERRLIRPFREAVSEKAAVPHPEPTVLAIPGNHDWYDGLRAFTRLFCYADSRFADGWQIKQTRSYFAVSLPGHWWLLAIDVQLGAELDRPQIDFFEKVAEAMKKCDRSRTILVMPEPDWLEKPPPRGETSKLPEQQMEEILGKPPEVCIAGNLHHYQRHVTIARGVDEEPLQRITAGGGGAFLHPTHKPLRRRLRDRLERKASFPTASDSKRQRVKLLAFPLLNPSFGLVPAVLYTLLALTGSPPPELGPAPAFGEFQRDYWEVFRTLPGAAALLPLTVGVFAMGFFRERVSLATTLLSLAHLGAHLLAALGVAFAANQLTMSWLDSRSPMLVLLFVFGAGWLAGSMVVGLYLWGATLCGRCLNQAYSALRIQDWKGFLRLRIQEDGKLTIFPIGIQRVSRRWARRTDASGCSRLVPDDPRATPPELVEMPIVIPPR